jgi:hypothetical protein
LAPAIATNSDVMKLLNIPGAPAAAETPPPRLMSAAEVAGTWTPPTQTAAARSRNAKLIIAACSVVAAIVIVVLMMGTKKKQVAMPTPPPKAAVTDPLAKLMDNIGNPPAQPPPEPPKVEPPPTPPTPPPRTKVLRGRGGRILKGQQQAQPETPPSGPGTTPTPSDPNARFAKDNGKPMVPVPIAPANRPPPSQTEISKVINNNRGGIKNCYQRALLRDNSLTHGKITVQLTLGISGRVKRATIDGPAQFRQLEPCIRELTSRWVFPQASEEYGTEFVYVFQGNE